MIARGRVQGVGFRDACRRHAQRFGVDGWVANRADGTVEAVFEGEPAAVEELVRWCRSGPPHARVESLEVNDEPPSGEHGFAVNHAPG